MTRDDIIRMAEQAGLPMAWVSAKGVIKWVDLERFFKLAYEASAAAEKEACARVCESVIEEIRETADNVLSHEDCRSIQAAQDCAAAIRARSKE